MFKMNAGILVKGLFAVVGLQLLCSCAGSYITPNFSRPGFSLDEFKAAKSILVVSDKAQVLGFRKSFANAYGSGASLSSRLSQMLADSLNASGISVSAGSTRLSAMLDSASLDTAVKVDSLFQSLNAKYVIHVGNILIGSSTTYTTGVLAPSGPGGSMAMTGGGSSTNCTISYDVDIWNVDGKSPVSSFKTKASSSVFLFFYQTALENTVWKSIRHVVGYLGKSQPKS